jgi:hypothetical protein
VLYLGNRMTTANPDRKPSRLTVAVNVDEWKFLTRECSGERGAVTKILGAVVACGLALAMVTSVAAKSTSGHASTYTRHSQAVPGVKRDSHGRIERSSSARSSFQHSHPCPSTGKASGACPGYVVDRRAVEAWRARRSGEHAVADGAGGEAQGQGRVTRDWLVRVGGRNAGHLSTCVTTRHRAHWERPSE